MKRVVNAISVKGTLIIVYSCWFVLTGVVWCCNEQPVKRPLEKTTLQMFGRPTSADFILPRYQYIILLLMFYFALQYFIQFWKFSIDIIPSQGSNLVLFWTVAPRWHITIVRVQFLDHIHTFFVNDASNRCLPFHSTKVFVGRCIRNE